MSSRGDSLAKAAGILLALTLAAGCASAPARPQTMRDTSADFASYTSFGLAAAPAGKEPAQAATIVDGYIRTALANEMKAKGYVEAPEGSTPDLVVEYAAASAEKLKNNPFRIGVGVGSYGGNVGGGVGVGSPSVKNVKEGSLAVYVIDPERKAEVWRGSIARELGKGGVEPGLVQAAVTELFSDFPARASR